MADSGYDAEVSGIQAFLSMQHDKGDVTPLSPGQVCSNILKGQNEISPSEDLYCLFLCWGTHIALHNILVWVVFIRLA